MANTKWIEQAFSSVDLKEKRLHKRLLKIGGDLAKNPGASIQAATTKWREAKAAYRLFSNEKLQAKNMLNAHQKQTIKRLKASSLPVYLAIQDTTKLNYTHHAYKKEMGILHHDAQYPNPVKGCLVHSTLVTTEQGLPLGLLDQKTYKHAVKSGSNKQRPITEKESYRWLTSLQKTVAISSDYNVITVCDREADILEFLKEAEDLGTKALVRSSFNRILCSSKHASHENLWPYLKKQPVQSTFDIHVPAKNNRKARIASLELRYAFVELVPPQRRPKAQLGKLTKIALNAIYIVEVDPPKDIKKLEWILLTNVDINSPEDAMRAINWYKRRWQIENFHRVLKSGCKIEDCRLETYERLEKMITIKSIIACRLLHLTHVKRHFPDERCDTVLSKNQWQPLYCTVKKTKCIPKKIPTVSEAILMIAQLGGFLNRKCDGAPGMTHIWRGWTKLEAMTEIWSVFQDEILQKA